LRWGSPAHPNLPDFIFMLPASRFYYFLSAPQADRLQTSRCRLPTANSAAGVPCTSRPGKIAMAFYSGCRY